MAPEKWPGRVDSKGKKCILGKMLTKAQVRQQARELPPEERTGPVIEIRDSLRTRDVPVPAWQRNLLRERLAAPEGADPEDRSTPWDEIRDGVFPRTA